MTLSQEQFYEQHKDADGNLSDEQTLQMMDLPEQGDTTKVESSDKPDVASEPVKTVDEAAKPVAEPKPEPETTADPEPVVLTRDGKHTIPYSELAEAREKAQLAAHWEQVAKDQAAELEALKKTSTAAPVEPAKTEPAQAEPLFGDFSEEDLKKGVEKLVEARVATALAEAEKRFAETLTPYQQAVERARVEEHTRQIYTAHPDADSVVQSPALKAWIEAQPSFVQKHYAAVLDQGTASEVTELFTAFKAATKSAPAAAPAVADPTATAEAVIAKAKAKTPTTLSDIATGAAPHHDEAEAAMEMTPTALLGKFEGMSPAKVEELLSRVL